jgi:hypothetical protein
LEVHVASSWPALEHCRTAQEGEKWEEGWGRGNIVFRRESNVIVMKMTNKSVQKKSFFHDKIYQGLSKCFKRIFNVFYYVFQFIVRFSGH